MLARCHSACARGIDGEATEVEVHLRTAAPRFDVVGLPDAAGREARDRVRSAIVSSGYKFPRGRVVVNLAPADTPKVGPVHDLPIAVAILATAGLLPQSALDRVLLFGELALDGRLRPVRGAFLLASTARRRALDTALVPGGNGPEAALAAGVPVHAADTLADVVQFLTGARVLEVARPAPPPAGREHDRDFSEVRGQGQVKEALLVAAAGGHNVLLVGPPGAGKTLLAQRFADVLPPLTTGQALEVARIRSAAGLSVGALPRTRPFRAPTCGASAAGVIGGGHPPGPGEVSLAHRGVLFLDELPQFRGDVLESLRGPLEDGRVSISRAGRHVAFPARFQLLAAMNPCPCGHGSGPRCRCTPSARDRYRHRISGPLLDRIDLRVHVPAVTFEKLRGPATDGLDTATMRARVEAARARQRTRQGATTLNAQLRPRDLERSCRLDDAATSALKRAAAGGALSARGVVRVLRVARTLADLAERDDVGRQDVMVALRWRVEIGTEA